MLVLRRALDRLTVMSISNSSQGITLSQQQSQGFLTLPWTPLPLSISTGFSTAFAANPTLNPFIYDATPFDRDQLSRQRFLYVRRETQGNFSSVATSSTTAGKQHTSIAFGVSIGNEYLNAGVTGSYDQSVLENQAVNPFRLGLLIEAANTDAEFQDVYTMCILGRQYSPFF